MLRDILRSEYDETEQRPKWVSLKLWNRIMHTCAIQFNFLSKTKKQVRLFTGLFWNEFYTKAKTLLSNKTGPLTMSSLIVGDNYAKKVECLFGGKLIKASL